MPSSRFTAVFLLFIVILPPSAQARRIGYIPTLDQLEAPSSLICNAQVIATAQTGPDVVSIYEGGVANGYDETWMTARVKVLHVFKGNAPSEIVIRYRAPQPHAIMMDSPLHMHLAAGDRYRFFLKSASRNGEFVSALDGRIDDGFGLQTLCEDEADDSPPMSNEEAVRIAIDYVARKKTGFTFDPKLVGVWPDPGGIEFDVTLDSSINASAEQVTIAVFRDRTVNENGSHWDGRR